MANRRITLIGIIAGTVIMAGGAAFLTLRHPGVRTVTVPVSKQSHLRRGVTSRVINKNAGPTQAPLMMPVSGPIASAFGWQYSGALNEWYYNPGITIASKAGQPVRAAWAGRVTQVADTPHMGVTVTVNDGNGFRTVYGHLAESRVKMGQSVKQGQIIGTVGGNSLYSRQSGSHLDFQIYHGNTASNPMGYLHPSS